MKVQIFYSNEMFYYILFDCIWYDTTKVLKATHKILYYPYLKVQNSTPYLFF